MLTLSPSSSTARTLSASVALLVGILLWAATPAQGQSFDYPETQTVDSVEVYHGTRVPDPYQWMEDFDSESVQQWVETQNELTFGYLEQIPERERLQNRLRTLWDYPKYGVPQREAGHLFYSKNEGLQDQDVDPLARQHDRRREAVGPGPDHHGVPLGV